MSKRVQLAFDLKERKLKEIYSVQTERHYTHAYKDLRKFLEIRGYEHRQGSVYHSLEGKTRGEILTDLKILQQEKPWFGECVSRLDYGELTKMHDLLPELQNEMQPSLTHKLEKDPVDGAESLKRIFQESSKNMAKGKSLHRGLDR